MRLQAQEGTAKIQALMFLAAAGTGAIAIVALKMLGIRQFIVTAAPCIVMAAYASQVVNRYYRARADQIGDNLYYLGFIFTLVSLSVSLSQFSAGGTAEEIVANFGVALATTLLGVTLRVVFNQMRSDPVETEKEARLQLAEASRRLKVELMNASAEFGMAARAGRQSVHDAIEEMRENFGATLEESGTRLKTAVANSADGLTEASTELERQIKGAGSRLTNASDALGQTIDASRSGLDDANQAATDRNTEFNSVARKLIGAIERLANRMDERVGPIDDIGDRFASLATTAAELEQHLSGARSQIESGAGLVATLRRDASGAAEAASDASEAVREQTAALERSVASIARAETAASAIEAIPARVGELLTESEARLQGVVERALGSVQRAESSLSGLAHPKADDAPSSSWISRPSSTPSDDRPAA
jgi:hypothetical protein